MTPPLKPGAVTSASGEAERGDVSPESFEAIKDDPETWTLTIPAPTAWISLNHRMHWAAKAKLTKSWRLATSLAARNADLPKGLAHVHITATVTKPTRRAFDVHNLLGTFKAQIDGLVDHGLVADDSTKYLTGPDMRVDPNIGPASVTLTIKEIQ